MMRSLKFLTMVLALLGGIEAKSEQKYDDRFVIRQPLQNSKFDQFILMTRILGTFNHWKASGTAVFLRDRIILTPELFTKTGLVYAKNVSQKI